VVQFSYQSAMLETPSLLQVDQSECALERESPVRFARIVSGDATSLLPTSG
jgi:hypothetical protein